MRLCVKVTSALLAPLCAVALAACGGGAGGASGPGAPATSGGAASDGVLTAAYQDQPTGGIDPDVFYGVEGESIISSVYEGLVKYEPGSVEIGPALATRWTVSRDGRTYTFTLRGGVRFHDGTTFDAAAVKANLERRIALKQAVAYMLAGVERIETPNARTVVIRLKARNNAFLDNLASMYGPKMVLSLIHI